MSKKMATAQVPYLLDLAQAPSAASHDDADAAGATEFRQCWKTHLRAVLPHAERGVRNFMLTCLAEGRAADDDEEKSRAKGPAVVCNLSLASVHAAVALPTKGIVPSDDSYVSKLIMDTAKRAAELTKLNVPAHARIPIVQGAVWSQHTQVPAPPQRRRARCTRQSQPQ